jgi:hypothetical protein
VNRPGLRDRWRLAVMRSDQIQGECRALLLVLSLHMDDSGEVAISRETLAGLLGVHYKRISERINQAKAAGLLAQIGVAGGSGRPAKYCASIPASGTATASTKPTKAPARNPTSGTATAGTKRLHLVLDKRAAIGTATAGTKPARVVPPQPVPNARASKDNTRQYPHTETTDCEEPTDVEQERIDEGNPVTDSALEAQLSLPPINSNCEGCQRAYVFQTDCPRHGLAIA